MAGETATTAPGAHGAPAATSTGTSAGTIAETQSEHKAFPPFDSSTFPSQLLWLAITFGLLYYLMAKIAVPRIAGILEDRRDRIANDLDQAERLREETQAAEAAYEKALGEARAKAYAIAEDARDKAKAAAAARQAETEAELSKQLESAEARIGEIKSRALADVGAIAGEAAEAVIRTLTDESVAGIDIEKAVSAAMAP